MFFSDFVLPARLDTLPAPAAGLSSLVAGLVSGPSFFRYDLPGVTNSTNASNLCGLNSIPACKDIQPLGRGSAGGGSKRESQGLELASDSWSFCRELLVPAKLAGVSIVGQKKLLNERDWKSPISIPKHVTDDLNIPPDTQDTEDRFHLWENDPLKRSLESSSEPLEGTSESHVGDISQDLVVPPVQRRKLDPLPKKHRHLRKAVRKKRTRKSKRKGTVETHCSLILPTPLVPPQSEDDEVVHTKLTLLSAQEDDLDLPNEDRLPSQQNEGACVMHQECQIQPCELSVAQEPGPSSPAVTSVVSPPHCFGRFLSCVCQTFSRSGKRKPPRREGTVQAEAGGDAKAPRPGLLRGLGKNKVQPN
ncbi:uncharacterized protein LOC131415070 [Diceros bicornis minor]|uniref:uncharacterized protein LOC131415070 n=1 Tax=Diceros bicornis minor TaxID=77932 RepID=UPI0026EA6AB1|nr:uncharacterized protein LOC131415070 [Diceros bicornis minor]